MGTRDRPAPEVSLRMRPACLQVFGTGSTRRSIEAEAGRHPTLNHPHAPASLRSKYWRMAAMASRSRPPSINFLAMPSYTETRRLGSACCSSDTGGGLSTV